MTLVKRRLQYVGKSRTGGDIYYETEVEEEKDWVTLDPSGTHVFLDGKGEIAAGPSRLEGHKPSDIPDKPKPSKPKPNKPKPEKPKPNGPKVFREPKSGEVRNGKINPPDEKLPTEMTDYVSKLTGTERESLLDYSREGYRTNGALRSGKELNEREKQMTDDLNKVIDKAGKLPEPVTCWRGVQLDDKAQEALMKQLTSAKDSGKDIELGGFISSSLNPSVSVGYALGGVTFEIKANKGIYLDAVRKDEGTSEDQRELVMSNKSKYRVIGFEDAPLEAFSGKQKPTKIIRLEQVA